MAYLDKVLHFGLLAIAFSLPIIRLNHVTEYLYLALLIIWFGKTLVSKNFVWKRSSLDLPILVLLGWALLTVPFATDWGYSLAEWQKSIPRFLMFWFVLNAVQAEQDVFKMLHAFSLGLVLVALMETAYFFSQGGNPLTMTMRAGDFSGSSQWFSCMLVIGLPILCLGAFSEGRGWMPILYRLGLGFVGVTLFLVHTRSAWVAVMVQGIFYGFLKFTKSWVISGLVICLVVSLFILFLAVPGQHREVIASSKFTSPKTMLLRFNTWSLALEDIRENPVVGIGYGKNSFHLKHPNLDERFHTHVHNFFLSSAVQIGITGLLIIIWMFGVIFHKSYIWSKRFGDQFIGQLSLVITLITLGLLVRLLFDDMLIGNVVYLLMLLFGGFFRLGWHIEGKTNGQF